MLPFSQDKQLNREHDAYKKLSGLLHGFYFLALAVVGIWCVVQIVDAGSISALTWRHIWKLLLGVPICFYLLGAINRLGGISGPLHEWEQSLLTRRELEELKLSLREGGTGAVDGIEVKLVDGFLVPTGRKFQV
jgi:hypothetical protein